MSQAKLKATPPVGKKYNRLSPKELRRLVDRVVASKDPAEVARLKAELERGFYGRFQCLKFRRDNLPRHLVPAFNRSYLRTTSINRPIGTAF